MGPVVTLQLVAVEIALAPSPSRPSQADDVYLAASMEGQLWATRHIGGSAVRTIGGLEEAAAVCEVDDDCKKLARQRLTPMHASLPFPSREGQDAEECAGARSRSDTEGSR